MKPLRCSSFRRKTTKSEILHPHFNSRVNVLSIVGFLFSVRKSPSAAVHGFLSGFRTRKSRPRKPICRHDGGEPESSTAEVSQRSVPLFARCSWHGAALHRCQARIFYTAAEVGLLVTYFILRNNASNTREDYRDVVRQHVNFIGSGSFEDWDPIEDFEHATQYETWNHVYDSEETRKRTGKWYWEDIDPTLKNEADLNIDFDSRYRLEGFRFTAESKRYLSTRSDSLRCSHLKPCCQCCRGAHYHQTAQRPLTKHTDADKSESV